MTGQWAARAGLTQERADDFVIAINEIATNAVRYGSPVARLLLRAAEGGGAEAEIRDAGRWSPGARAAAAAGRRGGMGLPLAREICDAVEIRTGASGTTVILRISLPGRQATHPPGQRGYQTTFPPDRHITLKISPWPANCACGSR